MIGNNNCPNCGSPGSALVVKNTIDPLTNELFDIEVCPSCSVGITRPFDVDLTKYYAENYREFNPTTNRLLSTLYALIAKLWTGKKSIYGKKFLEIGCGPGFFLKEFYRRGCICSAIERESKQLDELKKRFPKIRFYSSIEELDEQKFDYLLLYHVLEHLERPAQLLKKISSYLAPNAVVIIAIPNFQSLQNKLFGHFCFHLDPPRHRYHISEKALRKMVFDSHLSISNINRFHPVLDTFCFMESLVNIFYSKQNFFSKSLLSKKSSLLTNTFAGLLAATIFPLALLTSLLGYLFNSPSVITYRLNYDNNE